MSEATFPGGIDPAFGHQQELFADGTATISVRASGHPVAVKAIVHVTVRDADVLAAALDELTAEEGVVAVNAAAAAATVMAAATDTVFDGTGMAVVEDAFAYLLRVWLERQGLEVSSIRAFREVHPPSTPHRPSTSATSGG